MKNKFKVGDYVKANEQGNREYNITDYSMKKGEIISIDGKRVKIKIVEHKDETKVGEEFEVNCDNFDLYFSLSDIQFADILTLRNGEKYVVADGYMMGEKNDYYCDADEIKDYYNDNLTIDSDDTDDHQYDIVQVERAGQVIYERETTVEMTIAEISEKLGYEVKVVKEK